VTSLRGIAKCLDARGFKNPNGKAFKAQTVTNLSERIGAVENEPKAGCK
jgi:hypothetical protein